MKRIKYSSLVLILFLTFQATAQDSTYQSGALYPKKGDFGASIIVDGLLDNIQLRSQNNDFGQNLLFAKYYLEDDLVLRMGFGLKVQSQKRETADSLGQTLVNRDSSASQYFINFSGGIEKHLQGGKRLDPYLFGQLDLTFIGKTNAEVNSSTSSAAGTATTERTIKADGGIALGIIAGGGFNYFVAPKFSLGAEMGLRITYSSEGGTITDNTVDTPINGNSTTTFITRDDKLNTTLIDVQPNVLINLSYFF